MGWTCGTNAGRKLLALLLAACPHLLAVAQEPALTEPVASSCRADEYSWTCYGEIEVNVTLTGDDRSASIPLERIHIRHFSNAEFLLEREFPLEPDSAKAYFVASPSGVELYRGWSTSERPLPAVIAELSSAFKVLQAAFPGGPKSIEPGERSAVAQVTNHVYGIGEREEKVPVLVRKDTAGTVLVQYEGIGEPLGPYRVAITWNGTKPAPLADDIPATAWRNKAGLRFSRLGDARGAHPRQE